MITWTAREGGDGYEGMPGHYFILAKIDDNTGQVACYPVYRDRTPIGTAFSLEKAKAIAERCADQRGEQQ